MRILFVLLCLLSLIIMAVGCQSGRERKPVGVMSSAPLTKAQRDAMNQWSRPPTRTESASVQNRRAGRKAAEPAEAALSASPQGASAVKGGGYTTVVINNRETAPEPSRTKWAGRKAAAGPAEAALSAPPREASAVKSGGRKKGGGYTTVVIKNRETVPESSRSKRAASRKAEPAESSAPAPEKRSAKTKPAPAPQPAPASGVITEQDLSLAYQQFDDRYLASLGKSRKELKDLWGFPMNRLGDNGTEVAYGFRQRGVLNVAEGGSGKAKKASSSYYASGDIKRDGKGKVFACLVVLWVDKGGRGVVVDGDAVGDCFHVESLPLRPAKFER